VLAAIEPGAVCDLLRLTGLRDFEISGGEARNRMPFGIRDYRVEKQRPWKRRDEPGFHPRSLAESNRRIQQKNRKSAPHSLTV
jgi:hypothetical protein